jgi:hypothetical protein
MLLLLLDYDFSTHSIKRPWCWGQSSCPDFVPETMIFVKIKLGITKIVSVWGNGNYFNGKKFSITEFDF